MEARAKHRKVNKRRRWILLSVGVVFCIVAAILIVPAIINICNYDLLTEDSLNEAEDLVKEFNSTTAVKEAEASVTDNSGTEGSTAAASAKSDGKTVVADKPDKNDSHKKHTAGNVLGILVFHSLNDRKVPIIEGAEPDQLSRGAGHHPDMSLPGEDGNCLIFGHRNTVFRSFGDLKDGDTIEVETAYGTYFYKIIQMKIVEPLDPLMFKGYRDPMLTLVTCYPFNYVGHAPKRYVVVCKLDSQVTPSATVIK